MSDLDFFTTDFSFLGNVEQSQTVAKTTGSRRKRKVNNIGGILYEITPSAETRAKISRGHRGKVISQAQRLQISASVRRTQATRPNPQKGSTLTSEHRQKLSLNHRGGPQVGHKVTAETKAKIAANKGRIFVTPQGNYASMSAAARAYNLSVGGMQHRCKTNPTEFYYNAKEST